MHACMHPEGGGGRSMCTISEARPLWCMFVCVQFFVACGSHHEENWLANIERKEGTEHRQRKRD